MSKVVDAPQRLQALNVAESFVVQAPAGSGKTELLTQRLLALLATADEPEQVVAITFTRKAASEMRDRLLHALNAAQGPEPEAEHAKQTWSLASRTLARDAEQGWGLLASPSRLRIQTIDSLCGSLVRQMPVLSQLGGSPVTVDDARPMYQESAERVLREALTADAKDPLNQSAKAVLVHMDGRFHKVLELIASMLGRRDQWLRHLAGGQQSLADSAYFAEVVNALVEQKLQQLSDALPSSQQQAIHQLCCYAASHLPADGKYPALQQWREVLTGTWSLGCEAESLTHWLGVASCLLTDAGSYRKRLDKNSGFPAGAEGKAMKGLHAEVCESLAALAPEFESALHQLRGLPMGGEAAAELAVLPAIATLLRAAVIELQNLFVETNEVDHTEVTQMALQALGSSEQPTDLALALDYQIKHVLADEVQDTSHNQFELFRRLTAGWQAGDGRTFFAVGDPMQSIYGFREADVGLFLNAWHHGLSPSLPLTALRLTVNFRSQAGVVEWVNQQFSRALPEQEDVLLGAIPYAPSDAFHPDLSGDAVQIHLRHKQAERSEAEDALAVIRQALAEQSDSSIAVLARSRAHVAEIVQTLREAGIAYRAVELEQLGERSVVSDLMQLTFALLTPADRLAWLAVLRAPFCGLLLEDLFRLVEDDKTSTVPSLLLQRQAQLSMDGQQRAARLLALLPAATEPRSLRAQVEAVWFGMAGPQLADAEDMEAARLYLDTLSNLESQALAQGRIDSVADLERAVLSLYAPPSNDPACRIDVMTMHKSKGLQFDVVLLPGLAKGTRAEGKMLLRLQELSLDNGEEAVLLAPLSGQSETPGSIYQWLQNLVKDKRQLESVRLLYVAATRAKQRLHLFASLAPNAKGELRPPSGSLIAPLWSGLKVDTELVAEEAELDDSSMQVKAPSIRRLAADWSTPTPPQGVVWNNTAVDIVELDESLAFDWASPAAMIVGTVLHGLLQAVAEQGLESWQQRDLETLRPSIAAQLAQQGLTGMANQNAAESVMAGLYNSLNDEQGQWLLAAQQEAVCEAPFSHVDSRGSIRHSIVDRSFVENDVRWIVDYKTGGHGGGDVEAFLEQERQRYAKQLERYGAVYRQLEPQRTIKLALYFPLMKRMVSWQFTG